ncbi:MAG: GrpB family protein [Candidatus Izimaplasma sp.]|nr:GrpB family protein [Candidatus Izimaplasma bacterium]
MHKKRVLIKKSTPIWEKEFKKIKRDLEVVLNDIATGIEHVGSTSIPDLLAKPIIDIIVIIPDYSFFQIAKERMGSIGYIYEGDLGISQREAFYYSGDDGFMRRHVYICPNNSKELKRHIGFREYLKEHRDLREEYSKIKKDRLISEPNNINKYIKHKKRFVKKIYSRLKLN